MVVPMKKVSLIVKSKEKTAALKKLRHLGILHIEVTEAGGEGIALLQEQQILLENSIYTITQKNQKEIGQKDASAEEALTLAKRIADLTEERKGLYGEILQLQNERERLKKWGEVDPDEFAALREKGIDALLCEMSPAEYDLLGDGVSTVVLERNRNTMRFLAIRHDGDSSLEKYRIALPAMSTAALRQLQGEKEGRLSAIADELASLACYVDSMKQAIQHLQKETEFEIVSEGMVKENLSATDDVIYGIAYFTGYLPTEDLPKLTDTAKENAWGLLVEDPTPNDNVPTKLHNNKFVSLIYPLTDFLGTVPGYFEYDISGWFLGFILVFFGIIFGDGGYGLLICAVAAVMMLLSYRKTKALSATALLIGLMGLATVLWGTLTCTWFGIAPANLPIWLQKLSVPFLSNVYADKIWYPFWTNGEAGLTTTQNVQIFCFTLALVQLTIAHVKGLLRNRKSLKMLSEIGSILQLIGMYYIVLTLVVNSQVFGFGLVIGGIPVGTVAVILIAVGFVISFVFANYEGSIGKSIVASLKNIVSVLLGVVNVFSDIVSYIRLWAVGLAGSAISATVNDLAGPMLGNLMFILFAILILVFGHGLNMILNVLSVIVHGVRLNTLEFSTHLDMSWNGHKYKPFEE